MSIRTTPANEKPRSVFGPPNWTSQLASMLSGCSYQLGSMLDDRDEQTATIRPLPKGVVDPAPNDPYRIEPTSRSTTVPARGKSS